MAINLTKGQKINLSKEAPSLDNVLVGLGWKANAFNGQQFDLDASAFMMNTMGKTQEEGFVFYNNLVGPNQSVQHMGDERTGGDGNNDDEQITIVLSKVPENIEKIAITVTIDQYEQRRQNFGMVEHAYLRIVNNDNNEEVARYDLEDDFSLETAVVIGEFYRKDGSWRFSAVGQGFAGGLQSLCKHYGLDAEYR